MSGQEPGMEEALRRRCIADTSLLNNFVHSGNVRLLNTLLGRPVHLSPTVLDVQETLLPDFPRVQPASEFLKPLYMSGLREYPQHRSIAPFVQSFALGVGNLWDPVDPDLDELTLAARLSNKSIRDHVRRACPDITRPRIELNPGEAEIAAIAVTRGWTFLTDDQASAELLRCLYPDVQVLRTCSLLVHAVRQNYVSCEDASDIFNRHIVEELGFWAFRRTGRHRERLWFRCDPPRCEWASRLPPGSSGSPHR